MSWLRRYFPRTYMAQRNLQRAKIRTALAVLTVAVGVLAVGGLGVFGLAFEENQEQNLGDIANEVRVQAPTDTFAGRLAEDPPELTERRLDLVDQTAGNATMTVFQEVDNDPPPSGEPITSPTTVLGVSNPTATYDVVRGTVPDEWDSGVLVDESTASIFDLEIGDPVEVDGRLQTVIAVIEPPSGTFGVSRTNSAVLVPLDLVRTTDAPYRGMVIHTADSFAAEETAEALQARLNDPLREGREEFEITARQEDIERITQQFTSTNTFLLGVGSISLLIAGISIGNLQLMSARERRAEIGVLRAVGYGRLDILAIMLIEALLMGLLAALLGTGLVVGAGLLINDQLLADPLAFQPNTVTYVAVAFVFGVAVCVLAGLYPAWRASRERPVEALQG